MAEGQNAALKRQKEELQEAFTRLEKLQKRALAAKGSPKSQMSGEGSEDEYNEMEGAGAGEEGPALPSPKLSFDLPPAPIASALSAEALEELKAELTTLMEEQIAQAKV